MAAISAATSLLPCTRAVSLARLTSADSTPGTLASAFSTRTTQEAQVMPSIVRVFSMVFMRPLSTLP
jgi:hypothetical protein